MSKRGELLKLFLDQDLSAATIIQKLMPLEGKPMEERERIAEQILAHELSLLSQQTGQTSASSSNLPTDTDVSTK